jgi:hypothetical protein
MSITNLLKEKRPKMNKKEHNIHDFDIAMICEYFSGLDRQGPGSNEATIKA